MNRQTYAGLLALIFLALALAFLTSCNSSNFNAPAETIAATSGTPQTASVNTAFPAPLVATVSMGGSPVTGAFVTFTAPSTGASGTFANGTNSETDTTDATGVVMSSTFTANGALGADIVTASVAGVTATTTFNLTNASGPPAAITATSGSLQDATIGTAFAAPLVAMVVDSNQYPVTGASVTFTAPSTGATGTFSNATATETDTTDANGAATSSTFTANAITGGYTVMATVTGVATAANFTLTNVTGALISIAPTSGTPQSATVNATFAAPLVATVTSGGSPVTGALVTFTAPVAAAGGTFVNGTNTDTETTNASGVATSTAFTANGSVGAYTVTATVASGSEPANFVLTNTAITYTFYLNGLEALNEYKGVPNYYALAGSVTVDGNGNVLGGEQDYNDGFGLQSPEPTPDTILPGTSALTVDPTTGQGTLTLTTNNANLGNSGVETLGVQFVNLNHALIVQFDGSATSSGTMDTQTSSSALNDGNYAFTLTGVDTSYSPVVYGGVFSISSGGTALSGTFDEDDFGATTLATSFSGTITAPDSFGRGTITSTALAISLNYYVVGPEALRIIDVDSGDSAVGSVFGQGTGTFGEVSLGSSVFAIESNSSYGNRYAAAGQFTIPFTGSFNGVADDNEFDNGIIVADQPIGGSYQIQSNGYGSLTITPTQLGDVSVLGIYMTDPALNLNDPNNTTSGLGGALIADLDALADGTGVLTPQTDTTPTSFAGSYAFGAQAYNDLNGGLFGWEFDFVGQGTVKNLALSKALGLVSDPFFAFGGNSTGTDVKFQGIASQDGVYAGRYTIRVGITVPDETPVYINTVVYQASGGQLFWLDEDPNGESVFLGSLQQQSSLTGLPARKKPRREPIRKQANAGPEGAN